MTSLNKFTKANILTLVGILVALGFICYSRDASGRSISYNPESNFLSARTSLWERVLATATYLTSIGNYTIKDADKTEKYCKKIDIRNRSKDTGGGQQQDLDKFFTLGRGNIKKYLIDQDTKHLTNYGIANIPTYAVSVLSLVLSIVCLVYL